MILWLSLFFGHSSLFVILNILPDSKSGSVFRSLPLGISSGSKFWYLKVYTNLMFPVAHLLSNAYEILYKHPEISSFYIMQTFLGYKIHFFEICYPSFFSLEMKTYLQRPFSLLNLLCNSFFLKDHFESLFINRNLWDCPLVIITQEIL